MRPRAEPEFFVAYLPLPKGLRKFLAAACVLAIALASLAGFALARSTAGAGKARFGFGQAQGVVGVFSARPNPMLWTLDSAADGGVRGTLLVRQGKFGLSKASVELDGHVVRVNGARIERDGHAMLELSAAPELADDGLPAADRARIAARSNTAAGETRLVGEIVDSKCYLGRMRPGDRRTHRACAQLCIAGGIPAVFVTREAVGSERQYLLADRDGASISETVLPFVAEPVAITGQVIREGDVSILRTDLPHIERL